jgi:hypothetical protein
VHPTIINQNGQLGFRYRHRLDGGQVIYAVERSTDLIHWEPAGDLSPVEQPVENTNGTFTVTLMSNLPASITTKTYYRLVVSLQ